MLIDIINIIKAPHPGGGVTGLPGKNAAREIIKDL